MKILMLTSRFGSGYGMGYSSYKEAKCFADLSHNVTVVHCNSDIDDYFDKRIKFIHLPINKTKFVDFILFYFALKKLTKKINIDDFDVIYLQSLEFGLLKLSKIKKPIFYFSRSTMLGLQETLQKENFKKSFLSKINHAILVRLERRCMSCAELVFVKSKVMLDEVADFYRINRKKIILITGGIDKEDFKIGSTINSKGFRKKWSISSSSKIILYAGRIVPQKGLIYLIKAALRLLEDHDFVVVVAGLCGNKNYQNLIKKQLNSYVKSFLFIGHINQLEMSQIFNFADCVVTPSLYEPFGMVNLQAAFLGKNVITTNITGSIDVLQNYQGLTVVNAGSVKEIECSLRKILLDKKSKDMKSFNFDRYSWQNVANKIITSFKTIKE